MKNAALTLACSALFASMHTSAQTAVSASAPAESGVPVERLVAAVARKSGKTFVLDPRVHADVVIEGKTPTDLTYPELLDVLAVYGYATYDDGHFVRILPEASIRAEAIPTISARDTRPGAEFVAELIQVKNITAPQLVPILRPLVHSSGHLVAYPETQSLMIVDRFDNVRRIEGLIHALDSAGSGRARGAPDKAAPEGGNRDDAGR